MPMLASIGVIRTRSAVITTKAADQAVTKTRAIWKRPATARNWSKATLRPISITTQSTKATITTYSREPPSRASGRVAISSGDMSRHCIARA